MSTNNRKRLLFVCLGNICRSPAAEEVMRKMANDRGITDFLQTDSAGVGGWHVGELPDSRMRRHAAERGYILKSKARQLSSDDFGKFDYIVVMDDENYKSVSSLARNNEERGKILKMKDYFVKYKGCDSVPDPYYGSAEDFELALDLIEDGCSGLIEIIFG